MDHALELARHVGAELVLVHVGVIPETPAGVPESMAATVTAYSQVVKDRLAEDRTALQALHEKLSGSGVEVSQAVIDGFPDTGLLDAAREVDGDVIVIGTHGRTGFKRFLLGSVAERVVRLSDRPVLVARGTHKPAGGYRKIVVPTDFSEGAREAATMACQLAAGDGIVHLLHTWQLPPMSGAFYAPVKAAEDLFRDVRQTLSKSAAANLETLAGELRTTGTKIEYSSIEGAPAHAIQEWIDANAPDLVVMGSHGRRGVRRFLLGSVAEVTVRHAACSVLVVHSAKEKKSHA